MSRFRVAVHIVPRKGILDPQAIADGVDGQRIDEQRGISGDLCRG